MKVFDGRLYSVLALEFLADGGRFTLHNLIGRDRHQGIAQIFHRQVLYPYRLANSQVRHSVTPKVLIPKEGDYHYCYSCCC